MITTVSQSLYRIRSRLFNINQIIS